MIDLLAWFGQHTVLGIPADILAHFICGWGLYWIFRLFRVSPGMAILCVLTVAVLKEAGDPKQLGWELEALKDIAVTLIGSSMGPLFPMDIVQVSKL